MCLRPSHARPVRARDVLLCHTTHTDASSEEKRDHVPVDAPILARERKEPSPVELGRGIRMAWLPNEESKLVMTACSQRGHYFFPKWTFGQRYTYVLDVEDPEEESFQWDPDGSLRDVLGLSRLIRDNNHSTEFAARITDYEDGEQRVMPSLVPANHVYRLRRDRDWLEEDEAGELRDLLAAYWSAADDLPQRVTRASWRADYASWSAWADAMLPTLVGGLEALLKTERHSLTKQFTTRVPLLAGDLGIEGVTTELCDDLYDARSDWVHGAHVRLFSGSDEIDELAGDQPLTPTQQEAIADIARLQDVLRAAVRRAIEDPEFREVFREDDAIRERWPVDAGNTD